MTNLEQRRYHAFTSDYEQDLYAQFEPPQPANAHCWYTRGCYARLGKQGQWRRTLCSIWLSGPKGELPQ